MSISNEITRLDSVRDALVASVNSKGGSLADDATLWEVTAAVENIEVGSPEDPTPVVTQPSPSVNLNKTTGVVTASYTPVAGKVTDTAKKSATLQLTVQGAQTITPGTEDKTIPADRYLTGIQTIKGDANFIEENIADGVTLFGKVGTHKGGTDAPVVIQPNPTVSLDESSGKVTAKYTPIAGLVQDTVEKSAELQIDKATQPPPAVSIDTETGKVTASYTPKEGLVTDTAEKSATLQLETVAGQTITPGSSAQTIAGGKFLTGDIVVDAVENTGGGGGGGAFDLVAVTSYTPAYSQISSFVMSGMINDSDNSGYDLTPANGTYKVTAETASKPPSERIYKHTSQNYYVYYIPESADGMYWGSGWAINSNIVYDTMSVLMYNSTKDIVAGTSNWSGEMNMLSMSVTISSIVQSETPANIVGRKVTAYNPATLQYTFDSDDVAITAYEYEPQEHGVYLCNGTALVGEPIGNEGGGHLLMYIPWRDDTPISKVYDPREGNRYYLYATAWKYPSLQGWGVEYTNYLGTHVIDGVSCAGASNSQGLENTSDWNLLTYPSDGKLAPFPADSNRYWSASVAFNSNGQTSKKQRLFWACVNARIGVDAEWNASTPKIVVYKDDTAVVTYTDSGLASGWHHATLTYDYDTTMFVLYVDGVKRGEYSFIFETEKKFSSFQFGIGYHDNRDTYVLGYLCEIKLWDITLTAALVSAEYQRVMASM